MFQNTRTFYGLSLTAAIATPGIPVFAANADLFAGRQPITVAQLVESGLSRNPGLKAKAGRA